MTERASSPPETGGKSSREWLLVIFMAIAGGAVMIVYNAAAERMRVIESRIDTAGNRQAQIENSIVEIRTDMRNEFTRTREKLDDITKALTKIAEGVSNGRRK